VAAGGFELAHEVRMKRQIKIKVGSIEAIAELSDTKTAEGIWKGLPFDSEVNTWGNEIYFRIPLKMELEAGKEVVELGELGYWPPGTAFCIFFGSTPVSRQGEIRAASKVNIFGKLISDVDVFKKVKDGERIRVEKA
jgi:hypothetical protein